MMNMMKRRRLSKSHHNKKKKSSLDSFKTRTFLTVMIHTAIWGYPLLYKNLKKNAFMYTNKINEYLHPPFKVYIGI